MHGWSLSHFISTMTPFSCLLGCGGRAAASKKVSANGMSFMVGQVDVVMVRRGLLSWKLENQSLMEVKWERERTARDKIFNLCRHCSSLLTLQSRSHRLYPGSWVEQRLTRCVHSA